MNKDLVDSMVAVAVDAAAGLPQTAEGQGPWGALANLQHDGDPKIVEPAPAAVELLPRIPIVTAEDIHKMLPSHLQTGISLEWIHKNVPGKRRVGKWNVWPTELVMLFFATPGTEQDDPDDS